MTDFLETRLFPKDRGADAYALTGLAARCDLVLLSDNEDPVTHIVRRDVPQIRTIFLSLRNAEAALAAFHAEILPTLETPFVVVSGSEDRTFPVQQDFRFRPYSPAARRAIADCLDHPLLDHWYVENLSDTTHPKMSPLPLGMVFKSAGERDVFSVPAPPAFETRTPCALCAHKTRPNAQWQPRRDVTDLARKDWGNTCTVLNEETSEAEFIRLIREHAFTLCVQGGGIDPSPKAWLTLAHGGVPIVQSSPLDAAYRLLPVIIVDSWDKRTLSQDRISQWFDHWTRQWADPSMHQVVSSRLQADFWWNAIEAGTPIHEIGPPLALEVSAELPSTDEPNRWVRNVRGRDFKVDLDHRSLMSVQAGTLASTYRGVALQKNPFDRVIYLELLQQLRPRSIIEVGCYQGGSALWFQDQCRSLGLETQIVGIDVRLPKLSAPDGIRFFSGNAEKAEESFPHAVIADLPRPWLIIADSAHTFETEYGTLQYFADRMNVGDYIAVEDGVVADFQHPKFAKFKDGPNRAVVRFLAERDDFKIDTRLCDFFGHNVSYCPNGWLYKDTI